MTVIVSPHLDDAVFSLGEWLASNPDHATVVSVCTESETRRAEDIEALTLLATRWVHLGLAEGENVATITAALAEHVEGQSAIFPLGIHHPDHLAVARAAWACNPGRLGFYEELPYRVMWPVEAHRAIVGLGRASIETCAGHMALKHDALACYATQITEDVPRCCLAPERIWWVERRIDRDD